MNIKDLDGKPTSWQLTGNIVRGSIEHKSSYHILARTLLKDTYPTMQVLEEVPIHPRKSDILYLDFYLPLIKRCVEVHGEHHYQVTPHYHKNMLVFLQAQKRDKEKQEWCEINGIEYIALAYNENLSQWKQKIDHE